MTDIKISQLPSATSFNTDDLLAISRSLGGGNWESRSVVGSKILKAMESSRVIKVAKDGIRDADTIKDAVNLAIALSPTQLAPVVIFVSPAPYYEDNPITIPSWVTIISYGLYSAAVIPNNNGIIFNGSANSSLENFSIIGLASFSNTAYKYAGSNVTCEIKNCVIVNCYDGIISDNGSIIATNITGLSYDKQLNRFMSSINGGFLSASTCNVSGVVTRPVYGYYCYGTNSELYIFSCAAQNCGKAICANYNGYIDVLGSHIGDSDVGIHIDSSGSSHVKAVGLIIEESDEYDIQILSATSKLSFTGTFNSYSRNIVDGAIVNINADDEGTNGAKLTGESSNEGAYSIGYPGTIYENKDIIFNVGEGRSYYLDRYGDVIAEYWKYDATAPSGNKFTPYSNYQGTQLSSNNSSIVIGSKYPFPAIKLEVIVAANVGSNSIVAEYWDGSAWQETTMCAYSRDTMQRRDSLPFINVEDQYVEISQDVVNKADITPGWNKAINVLDQVPAWTVNYALYPIRFRNNGNLISGMTFRTGRVRGNGYQISSLSGRAIRWGKFRSLRNDYYDYTELTDDAVNPPSKTTVKISDHISYKDVPTFASNAVSQFNTHFIVPDDADTSSPLTCSFTGVISSSNAGSIVTNIYVVQVNSSTSSAGSLPETVYTQITNVSGSANSFAVITQDIDLSSYNCNDLAIIGFSRNGLDTNDTYDGDLAIGNMIVYFYAKFA